MRPIRRLMIANRGEIVARIARSARSLGIVPLGLGTEAEPESLALDACEESVLLRGATPAQTFLQVEQVLEAARRLEADAVHPGYGFLSENAAFARAVIAAGLVWVGPSPESIEAMGGKVEARERMIAAGVPVVPGSHSVEDAEKLGFPLMVKADAGGGGRGMRLVRSLAELPEALESAQREAQGAFGSPRVFLERFIERGRHVEVQVFGDQHGQVIALGERDCSTQRRHQKVIEESPSPAVDPALRERLQDAAVRAAKAVQYQGAGTVEFMLGEDGQFYFLEMNTRLQVEHPVTEEVTGWDLVAWQLKVAMGARLPPPPTLRGAAIELRLYAEDPSHGGLPQTGRLLDFHLPELPGVRLDSGVRSGSEVSPYYDPMLCKLIAWGEDREQARRRVLHALERLSVLGLVTNKAQLLGILQHPDFVAGAVHTSWLEAQGSLVAPCSPQARSLARLGALGRVLLTPRAHSSGAPLLPELPPAWRNSRGADSSLVLDGSALPFRPDSGAFQVEGRRVEFFSLDGPSLRLRVDGRSHVLRVVQTEDAFWVHSPYADLRLERTPDFPVRAPELPAGSLVAALNGRVLRINAAPGDPVEAGQVLLVLEAMKTEQALRAPERGVLRELRVGLGDQVEAGAVLAVVEPQT